MMNIVISLGIAILLFGVPASAQTIPIEIDPIQVDPVPPGSSGDIDLRGTLTKAKVRVKPTGQKLIVTQEICNDGDAPAGPFVVSLLLSADATLDDSDDLLDSFIVDQLDPFTCVPSTSTERKFKVKNLPSLDGRVALIVVDFSEDIDENDETNNVIVAPLNGPFLSSGKRTPGQFLTIAHPSIQEDNMVEVTFTGPNGYEISTMANPTTSGQVQVATPPFIDVATSNVIPGTVSVSVDGATGVLATLKIRDLPQVDAEPGAITREVLLFAMENYDGVISKLGQMSADTGLDSEDLVTSISAIQASLEAMAGELANQQLTVEVDNGFVTIDAEQLRLLDRLVAAHFIGALEEAQKTSASQASLTPRQSIRLAQSESQFLTRQGVADMLRKIKALAIPGVQVLGGYVSVTAGTVALVAVVIPGGQPLAGAAAMTAVVTTVVVTVVTAAGSFAADLTIDAAEGRTPDGYNAGQNALVVIEDGLTSVALTAGGAITWVGATVTSIAGLAFDTRSAMSAARDLICSSPQAQLFPKDFCDKTAGAGAEPRTLTLSIIGDGTVTMDPPCCTYPDGTEVTLLAFKKGAFSFESWSGACSGTIGGCLLIMDADKTVTATFATTTFTLIASAFPGQNLGTVTSVPPGIDCPGVCQHDFPENTMVTVTATPDDGFFFIGWGFVNDVDCMEITGPVCTVVMDENRRVHPGFSTLPP